MADKVLPLLAVVGPTASGKTGLGIDLARRLGGEVISCDSMQIYEGMDIATAKPTVDEMCGVPHHLIGYVGRDEQYSVARYIADARAAIEDVIGRGRLPILVGGTGLYYSALLDNLSFAEQPTDDSLRRSLNDEAQSDEGRERLLLRLSEIDPEYAATLHKNNYKRVIRALEVWHTSGVTMTEQLRQSRSCPSDIVPFVFGITYADREVLYERINRRVDVMLAGGLIDEARAIRQQPGATSAQAIGYKELEPYFEGERTLDEAVDSLKRETRRYAKRQLTWFRRDERVHWLTADGKTAERLCDEAVALIDGAFIEAASSRGINLKLKEEGLL